MGLAKPRKTRRLTGIGRSLIRQEAAGCVFGWVWNLTDLNFQSEPRPLAGYPDPLLTLFISNDPSFRQKHPGILDGFDGSDESSYPVRENDTLPVAQATGCVTFIPPLLCGDVYTSSERHMCYTHRMGCSYAEAVYTTPGDVYA